MLYVWLTSVSSNLIKLFFPSLEPCAELQASVLGTENVAMVTTKPIDTAVIECPDK